MFLTYEQGIRGGICNKVHSYAEANNKYMKNYDKNKESSFLMYVDANNLYGWAMSKKLPVDGFKWVDDLKLLTSWPLFMDGVQLPQGYSHFEEAVYFLPFSSQKFLILIYRPRKNERLSQPWSHPVVLDTGLLHWESSTLTTRPLCLLKIL